MFFSLIQSRTKEPTLSGSEVSIVLNTCEIGNERRPESTKIVFVSAGALAPNPAGDLTLDPRVGRGGDRSTFPILHPTDAFGVSQSQFSSVE